MSLLGSLGPYTSPIWMARAVAHELANGAGVDSRSRPHRPGRLHDRSAWTAIFATVTAAFTGGWRPSCRAFASFVFRRSSSLSRPWQWPSLPGWAGTVWPPGEAARVIAVFVVLLVLTSAALAGVALAAGAHSRVVSRSQIPSMFGPFDADRGLPGDHPQPGQATIVFGLGLLLTLLARSARGLAGSAALIVMTADLAAANARYIFTVPQAVFETKPEVLKIIEDAERTEPSPGPYRIHRMHDWHR